VLCLGQRDAEVISVYLRDTRPGSRAEILAADPVLSGAAHIRSVFLPNRCEMCRSGPRSGQDNDPRESPALRKVMNIYPLLQTLLLILVSFLSPSTNTADGRCSTFALIKGDSILVCNNDDWFCNVAYFTANPRGVTKQTFLPSADKKLTWTSQYGSVTANFNFVGSPSGGMNEMGLIIDESWPGPCRYPRPDDRPVLDEIQWLQYQFDNCATVDEVIETDSKLRIVGFFGRSHYFVCDKSGKAATIEWIDGERVVHILSDGNIPALTNHNYDWSLEHIKNIQGFGGTNPVGDSPSSFDRFCRAAQKVKEYAESNDDIDPYEYGFGVLDDILQRSTMFNWIYDINNLTIYYRTAWSRETKKIPLSKFDFGKRQILMADVLTSDSGDITGNFTPYTLERNRDFVTRVIKNWRKNKFAMHITEDDIEKMIHYPETMSFEAE
jgi:penicillin V acylase-like amidase (Ntn superfamily)